MSGLSNVQCWLEDHGIEPRPELVDADLPPRQGERPGPARRGDPPDRAELRSGRGGPRVRRAAPSPSARASRFLDRELPTYLDHLAVERGLSAATVAAYRADLEGFGRFLAEPRERGRSRLAPRPRPVSVFAETERPRRALGLARALGGPRLLRVRRSPPRLRRRPDRGPDEPEDGPVASEGALRGGGRSPAREPGRLGSPRAARPRDARAALRVGSSRLRDRGAAARRDRRGVRHPARARKGRQGAARAVRRVGRALARAVSRRRPARRSTAAGRRTSS